MASTDKRLRLGLVKSVDTVKKSVVAHVSTFGWDRMGERFEKGAWDLTNYKNNPVVLWGHDSSEPPIGKAIRLTEDDDGLFAEAQFDEMSDFAMEIFGLFERGYLNAFSVGFIPKKFVYENIDNTAERGLVYLDAELLEFSAVSIPANPGALISREMGELVIKTLGANALAPIDTNGVKGFMVKPADFVGEGKSAKARQGDALEFATVAKAAAGDQPATPPSDEKPTSTEPTPPKGEKKPTDGEPIELSGETPPVVAPPSVTPQDLGVEPEPPAPETPRVIIPFDTPPAAPSPTESHKGLLELAKMAKGMKIDKATVGMMGSAVNIFQEIISENSDAVTREDFDSLKSAVTGLGDVVKNLYPDVADTVRKIMFQVDKALGARAN